MAYHGKYRIVPNTDILFLTNSTKICNICCHLIQSCSIQVTLDRIFRHNAKIFQQVDSNGFVICHFSHNTIFFTDTFGNKFVSFCQCFSVKSSLVDVRTNLILCPFVYGGWGGIRTHGTPFEVHTLSKREQSTTLPPNQLDSDRLSQKEVPVRLSGAISVERFSPKPNHITCFGMKYDFLCTFNRVVNSFLKDIQKSMKTLKTLTSLV